MALPVLAVLSVLSVLSVLGLASCTGGERAEPTTTARTEAPDGIPRGFSVSPPTYDAEGMERFWARAERGALVTWAGDWRELAAADGAPASVVREARDRGLTPIVLATVATDAPGGGQQLLAPLDPEQRGDLVEIAATFAREQQPPYLGLGLEVDRLAESDPASYRALVDLFAAAATAVRQASPDTLVFPTFQLERTAGRRGGLFGGTDDPATNSWALLADFATADLIGISTYPFLVFRDPDDIPDDYLAQVRQHTELPVLVVETGWPSETPAPGWESDEAEQARYVERLPALLAPLEPDGWIWSFLFDPAVPQPFAHLGLLADTGAPRPGWEAWLAAD